jgi:alpha-tubulin suppressor-like RCC1 family protein
VQVGLAGSAVDVAAGADFSVALLADGRLENWGENGRGELGNAKTTDNPNPAVVTGLPAIQKVDCGRDHTLAVTTTGALWDWGWDASTQLGDGQTTNKKKSQQVSGISNAVEGSGGQNYSVLLRS